MGIIKAILEVFDVDSWEKLEGEKCRVKRTSRFGKILAIGNLIENKWFSFDDYFSKAE